jgi:hypothetical protein
MLGDHINIHLKQGVKIITCDPPSGVIEAETRNGEVISVNAYHQTPVFRWPVPGEKWMVTEENGSWFLDGIYEQQVPYEGKVVQPGDTVITAGSGTVWKNVEGQLEPLITVPSTLGVKDYIEDNAAQGHVVAVKSSKTPYVLKERSYSRFVLAQIGIRGTEYFGEIVVAGKHIALTERSGSVGSVYRTTMTIVVPPDTAAEIAGTGTGEAPGIVEIDHLWESIP